MIDWVSFIESPDRGYWDQTFLEDFLAANWYADVLVTPGHWRDGTGINGWLADAGRRLVFISSDEEGDCPFWLADAPVWKMTPNLHLAHRPDRAIPLGYTPHTRPALHSLGIPVGKSGWTFSGQVTNPRRHSAVEALRKLDGDLTETAGFTEGLEPAAYIKTLWDAEWVPCPAGNVRPETFRMWEALEAGAVPILDATSPHGDRDYWPFVLGDHPFPVLWDWSQVGEHVNRPAPMAEAAVWYSGFKAKLRRDLWDAWSDLCGEEPWVSPTRRITTIITASPIPSHPSFHILAETVDSIRGRLEGEIIIAFDGPHSEDDRAVYEEHIRRVCYHANLHWPNVWVWYTGTWKHQAGTIRDVLPHIYPDYATILFAEHDTPLVGSIDFERCVELLYIGEFDSIRFHHEDRIPDEHQYLMHGVHSDRNFDVIRTTQYSQRPHLTLLSAARNMYVQLPIDARTYTEDWWYGNVANSPWDHHKLGIYAPRRGLKRSYHLDGRAGADKREMWW